MPAMDLVILFVKSLYSRAALEENKNIKIQASISGNTEYNRLMKARINRLIKEVDMCISQLENNEL